MVISMPTYTVSVISDGETVNDFDVEAEDIAGALIVASQLSGKLFEVGDEVNIALNKSRS
jgi:hypothetical protein